MAAASRKGFFSGRTAVIAVPYLWLAIFFILPFVLVLKISLSETDIAIPPYTPTFPLGETWEAIKGFDFGAAWAAVSDYLSQLSFDNFTLLTQDALYWKAYLSSLWIAAVSTVLLLLVGYPIAYGMARAPRTLRPTLLMLVILPFWTSFLIRVYAWIGILKPEGLLNLALAKIGLVDMANPLQILNTDIAIYIGIVYSYLPFMVLPLYSALEKMDETLLEAAADLGCRPVKAFWLVTFPLSLPGVVAGCMLCFIPAVGEFVIPDLLGGSSTLMIGKTLWDVFNLNRDWPAASAVAVVLLVLLVVPIVFYQHVQTKQLEAGR
ncbi:ABC transporter permease subunit [Labrys wisconsinensis]|uniref:Putrescine transport system permease protein n=1 Tax=Labrys wisconsinensis TaxID=425677 RepID=A0ABU0JEB9_9HYPH|nr:putrescine transport system permease protein [Labrys wisconsinensis]